MMLISKPTCYDCDKPIENHQNAVKISVQQGAGFLGTRFFSKTYVHFNCVDQGVLMTQENSTQTAAAIAEELGDKE